MDPPSWLSSRVRARVNAWRDIGASPQVLDWLSNGVKPIWVGRRPPAPFYRAGRPLAPAERAPWQQLRAHYQTTGAIERAPSRTHVSPAFLIPKASGGWRLVVDLRWLNQHCIPFKCRFETLRSLGRLARAGDWMIAFDLQDGYHCVPIHPDYRKYFTFCVDGEYWQCAALPFGWLNAPYVFTKVMRPLVAYLRSPAAARLPSGRRAAPVRSGPLRQRAVGLRCLPYLDDFLCLLPSEAAAREAAGFVRDTLGRLGLQWHPRKSHWEPSQSLPHLGLQVDTRRGLFLVTPQRAQRLRAEAKALLCAAARHRRLVLARDVARFTGLAVATQLAIPAARYYLRSLYDALNTRADWGARVRLDRQCVRDLEWWLELPGRSTQRPIWRDPTTATLHCDASNIGWGGLLNGTREAHGFWATADRDRHITWKELAAVRLSVLSFLPWLKGRSVRLFEDNQSVLGVLLGLTSRSPALMAELRELWAVSDTNAIDLRPEYIRSADNSGADALSRLQLPDDWRLCPARFQRFDRWWGPHTTDCFASHLNRQVARYFSEFHDPGTAGVDVFARPIADWRAHNNWANPPWGLLAQLVHHLEVSGAACTVVAPYWAAQPWFGPLLALAESFVVLDPEPGLFLPGRLGGDLAMGPPRWRTLVCRVPLRPRRRAPCMA